MWQEYSRTGTPASRDYQQASPVLKKSHDADGQFRLNWEVTPDLAGGLRAFRVYRDGKLWKEIGVAPDDSIATGRDSTPEKLRQTSLIDDSQESHVYTLTFLDAAGNESPQSESVAK